MRFCSEALILCIPKPPKSDEVASFANVENLPRKTSRHRNKTGLKKFKMRVVEKTSTPESVLYPSEAPRRQDRRCLFVLFSGCTFPAEPPRRPPAPLAAQPAHRARAHRRRSPASPAPPPHYSAVPGSPMRLKNSPNINNKGRIQSQVTSQPYPRGLATSLSLANLTPNGDQNLLSKSHTD